MSDVRTFMSFEKASSRPYELSLYEMLYELYERGGGIVQTARSSKLPLLAGPRWYASTEHTSPGSTGFHISYRTP
jgi:hypothetical protein